LIAQSWIVAFARPIEGYFPKATGHEPQPRFAAGESSGFAFLVTYADAAPHLFAWQSRWDHSAAERTSA